MLPSSFDFVLSTLSCFRDILKIETTSSFDDGAKNDEFIRIGCKLKCLKTGYGGVPGMEEGTVYKGRVAW